MPYRQNPVESMLIRFRPGDLTGSVPESLERSGGHFVRDGRVYFTPEQLQEFIILLRDTVADDTLDHRIRRHARAVLNSVTNQAFEYHRAAGSKSYVAENPIRHVKGGYQWGRHGRIYPTYGGALKQARAAYAHGYRGNPIGEGTTLLLGLLGIAAVGGIFYYVTRPAPAAATSSSSSSPTLPALNATGSGGGYTPLSGAHSASLAVGGTLTVNAPADAAGAPITMASDNSGFATTDGVSTITGVSPGATNITITWTPTGSAAAETDTLTVTVQ